MQYIQIPNEAKTSIALGIIEQIEASGEHFICPNNQVLEYVLWAMQK